MTAPTLERPADERQTNGGRPARLAVVRWAWRLVRRDWRQQLLILLLLTFAVAAAAAGASAAYNIPPPANAELGAANHAVVLRANGVARPGQLASNLAEVRKAFDTAEVITRRLARIPGSTEELELRGQDPKGALGRPLLSLRSGRYPSAPGETAITDGVATTFGVRSGGDLELDAAPCTSSASSRTRRTCRTNSRWCRPPTRERSQRGY